jgi:hypothetical protein
MKMTAIEQFYASLPADLVNKPYYAGDDEEQVELSELEIEAEWDYYLLNQAGIRKSPSDADYRDF